MKKLMLTLCTIAVLTGITNSAFANETGCKRNITPEMKAKFEQRKAEFEKRLNLTPEQKTKMDAIHQESRAKIKPLFDAMKVEKQNLVQLQACATTPKETIAAEEAKVQQLRTQIKAIRKENFEKTQAILTPDQQKEFNKMHEERKKHRHNHKEGFGNK